jgi:phenylalanyl-tRNA synthetase alpha chain
MDKELKKIQKKFKDEIKKVVDLDALSAFETAFFGRKVGEFTALVAGMKNLAGDKKKEFGQMINDTKSELMILYSEVHDRLTSEAIETRIAGETIDVTEPKLGSSEPGHLHPITQMQDEIVDFFSSMGFSIESGPELESEYYTFEALNIPADHPARDMQDTFFIDGIPGAVMRTHTSSVQVRALEKYGAPLRIIVPGICFRNEATDPRHEHTFHQLEGLVVGEGISFAHLKGVLESFAKHFYGEATEVRLRPKFYPFVEPGVNGEITCFLCSGEGCRVCKDTGWLEVFGAGLVHPEVLRAGGVDTDRYSGFAFGFGLSRLVMLRYGIEDVRHFMSGDLRFLKQF